MKVFCKRTYFDKLFGGEQFVKWEKNKYYDMHTYEDWIVQIFIESEVKGANGYIIFDNISKKDFSKYFIKVDELRNNKIDDILNS